MRSYLIGFGASLALGYGGVRLLQKPPTAAAPFADHGTIARHSDPGTITAGASAMSGARESVRAIAAIADKPRSLSNT